ncbi:RRQRL motif-containing zinc-binding protein [Streptomyces sp. NPDC126514]|uniref:RRQRL motif-containing zinc-binding protein n=1 Tax=Streptomyces sp. NPDC126514 TaxID=3155210 RepID=UPI003325520E
MTDHDEDKEQVDVDLYDDGSVPEFGFRQAPGAAAVFAAVRGTGPIPTAGLATRRQLRAMGLSPGGHPPVTRITWGKQGRRWAWLYAIELAVPKRIPTLAQELALDKAMAARQTCPLCKRRYYTVLPLKTLGSCLECHDGTPADPSSYSAPLATHQLAA